MLGYMIWCYWYGMIVWWCACMTIWLHGMSVWLMWYYMIWMIWWWDDIMIWLWWWYHMIWYYLIWLEIWCIFLPFERSNDLNYFCILDGCLWITAWIILRLETQVWNKSSDFFLKFFLLWKLAIFGIFLLCYIAHVSDKVSQPVLRIVNNCGDYFFNKCLAKHTMSTVIFITRDDFVCNKKLSTVHLFNKKMNTLHLISETRLALQCIFFLENLFLLVKQQPHF